MSHPHPFPLPPAGEGDKRVLWLSHLANILDCFLFRRNMRVSRYSGTKSQLANFYLMPSGKTVVQVCLYVLFLLIFVETFTRVIFALPGLASRLQADEDTTYRRRWV